MKGGNEASETSEVTLCSKVRNRIAKKKTVLGWRPSLGALSVP